MVSAMVRMGDNEEMSPPAWLKPMLTAANYFVPCSSHEFSTKSECNMFCLHCMGNAFCSDCLIHHKDHKVVQIRRSSYHNVVKVDEIQELIDIDSVQTYIINGARIVFLNGRPQLRLGKGVTNTCEICCRSLLDSYRFCSLGCKLGGIKRDDPGLTFTLKRKRKRNWDELYGHESDDDDSMPNKMRRGHGFDQFSNAGVFSSDFSSIYGGAGGGGENHNAQCIDAGIPHISDPTKPEGPPPRRPHRRKGIPHRAPFF